MTRTWVALAAALLCGGCRADSVATSAERPLEKTTRPATIMPPASATAASTLPSAAIAAATTSSALPSSEGTAASTANANVAADGDDEAGSPEALVQQGLVGTSYNYRYDGSDIQRRDLAWYGRAYLSPKAAAAKRPLPLVVFLHGLNAAQIKYRWMGGGKEGDVRRIVGELIEQGKMQPAVVAGPSSVVRSQVARGSSWRALDLDQFLRMTIAQLQGIAVIDRKRIIVAGHSGAGCSQQGGILKAVGAKPPVFAILSLDTCMVPAHARVLAGAAADTHIIVAYQRMSWQKRDIGGFLRAFDTHLKDSSSLDGVYRTIEKYEPKRAPHDQVVPLALNRWLPRLLPPAAAE